MRPWTLPLLALLLCIAPAHAQPPTLTSDTRGSGAISTDSETEPDALPVKKPARLFDIDPDAYTVVSTARGLSLHKPTYIYPLAYSDDLAADNLEFVFQLSFKQRLFARPIYFGYTQKSFWQVYDRAQSAPFRETNYNPELFYRLIPDAQRWNYWGADFGFEHESNGQSLPDSRSWNRLYAAAFQAKGRHLIYLKGWYRIPERAKRSPDDAQGDDNPDIEDHLGYGEASYSRQIGGKQLLSGSFRLNPATGHGAARLTWSMPSADGSLFYAASVFHGYGESLIDYDREITRVMLGIMLSR